MLQSSSSFLHRFHTLLSTKSSSFRRVKSITLLHYKNLTSTPYTADSSAAAIQRVDVDDERGKNKFRVVSNFEPSGDQPKAIRELVSQLSNPSNKYTTLKGITGSGKSFVMSHTIAQLQKPALILCPTKVREERSSMFLHYNFYSNSSLRSSCFGRPSLRNSAESFGPSCPTMRWSSS